MRRVAEEEGPEVVIGVVAGGGDGAEEDGEAEGEGRGDVRGKGAEAGDAPVFELDAEGEVEGWEGEEGEEGEDGSCLL